VCGKRGCYSAAAAAACWRTANWCRKLLFPLAHFLSVRLSFFFHSPQEHIIIIIIILLLLSVLLTLTGR
jgi:hypothetical protein